MARVIIDQVSKQFGDTLAVENVSLTIEEGEFMVLVGPSGCGKTTILRMVAGLEDITEGRILIGDRVVNRVHPRERDVAMVFQSYALYPHMTVRDNLAYGLKMRHLPRDEISARVNEAANMLQIGDLLHRKPAQLSGGQRQRVALGRAIVRRPAAFLMDEPLSNLDAKLRVQMRGELIRLHQQLGVTTIYVTHDQVEAMTMGSHIAVMHQGRVQQIGPPMTLYRRPHNVFVATFIGSPQMNMIPGLLKREGDLTRFVSPTLRLDLSHLPIDRFVPGLSEGAQGGVVLGVRPEHFQVRVKAGRRDMLPFGQGQIEYVEQLGRTAFAGVAQDGAQLMVELDPEDPSHPGEMIELGVSRANLMLFDQKTGLALETSWI